MYVMKVRAIFFRNRLISTCKGGIGFERKEGKIIIKLVDKLEEKSEREAHFNDKRLKD